MRDIKQLDVRPELMIRVHPVDEDTFCLHITMNEAELMECFEGP